MRRSIRLGPVDGEAAPQELVGVLLADERARRALGSRGPGPPRLQHGPTILSPRADRSRPSTGRFGRAELERGRR